MLIIRNFLSSFFDGNAFISIVFLMLFVIIDVNQKEVYTMKSSEFENEIYWSNVYFNRICAGEFIYEKDKYLEYLRTNIRVYNYSGNDLRERNCRLL